MIKVEGGPEVLNTPCAYSIYKGSSESSPACHQPPYDPTASPAGPGGPGLPSTIWGIDLGKNREQRKKERATKLDVQELYTKKSKAQQKQEDLEKDIKERYGRKWQSGLKEHYRRRYKEKKKAKLEVKDLSRKVKDVIKLSILASGSIQKRFNTCGKDDCPCMHGGKRHGPYYYLCLPLPKDMIDAGLPRVKHFYITSNEAAEYQRRIDNLRQLQDQVWDEIWDDFCNAEGAI